MVLLKVLFTACTSRVKSFSNSVTFLHYKLHVGVWRVACAYELELDV